MHIDDFPFINYNRKIKSAESVVELKNFLLSQKSIVNEVFTPAGISKIELLSTKKDLTNLTTD